MLVLDASIALEVLLKTPLGVRCADHVLKADESLHAPHLLDVEFTQVLRRLTSANELHAADAQQALDSLQDLPLIVTRTLRCCNVCGRCASRCPLTTQRMSHWRKASIRHC